ncbi:MAG: sensor histidine kinase [Actinomycetota bacterium]
MNALRALSFAPVFRPIILWSGSVDPSVSTGRYSPGQVLRDLCHAFSAATDLHEVVASVGGWVQAALGTDGVEAWLALPDGAGRLRASSSEADVDGAGRGRSARRREAFRSKSPVRLNLSGPAGRTMVLLPLVCRGRSLGVLEVVAPRTAVEERWDVLEAVAAQVASALCHVSEEGRLRSQVETLERAASLGRDLVRAPSPEAAARIAVRFVCERFRVPVAAWVAFDETADFVLTEARGLGTRKRKELQAEMAILPNWRSLAMTERHDIVRRFGGVLGVEDVQVVDAGDAFLLAAHASAPARQSLEVVGTLLGEVLRYLTTKVQAERRSERIDLGIAWTAHEFRGPLLGVKAVLEFLLLGEDGSGSQALLRRSLRELEQLAGLVDGLLRWSVGAGRLRCRETDLVRVVGQAVESCELEMGDGRVSVHGPRHVRARIDPGHLRGAIANLVRNALSYSPPDAPVDVLVEEDDGWATVSVTDRGSGIPPSEWEAVFDPLIRGAMANGNRNGKGLGLFIARRVVQAHGGEISLKSDGMGSTFQVRVPLDGRGRVHANPPR